jgi:hypothetical protein
MMNNNDGLLPFSAPSTMLQAFVAWTNKKNVAKPSSKDEVASFETSPAKIATVVTTNKNDDAFLPFTAPSVAIGWLTA